MAAVADEYDDDYDDYYDDDEDGVSGFVVLVVALVVLVVFSAVVWFAYQRGFQEGGIASGRTPVVASDPTPVKTERELTLATSGTRQEVYDELEGNTPSTVLVDASVDRDPLEGFEETTSAAAQVAAAAEEDLRASAEAAVENADNAAAGVASETETAIDNSRDTIAELANAAGSQPSVTTSQPAPARPAATTPAATTGSAVVSTHLVQVGAFRSQVEAIGFFESMKTKHGAMMSGKISDIQRADLGERGIFFRLRIGPFTSKAQAQEYCNNLKSRGQDCLVKAA